MIYKEKTKSWLVENPPYFTRHANAICVLRRSQKTLARQGVNNSTKKTNFLQQMSSELFIGYIVTWDRRLMVSTKDLLWWCLEMEFEVNSLILKHINTVEHVRTLQGYDQYRKIR